MATSMPLADLVPFSDKRRVKVHVLQSLSEVVESNACLPLKARVAERKARFVLSQTGKVAPV
ncbi:hypothetical protein Poly24_11870 [Rosistilla carotiformis]|uniref:Uncharacterized protein n=1 Tax=Rosistilla carotiformis TaxID=2528017 RepID=A0A518JPL4_9BACT|nr:hypothetical protein Poly24_11870 [Rosistilla carotiformis]